MPSLPPPPSYDPAWCNAQYNNGARVPGTAAILDRWREAARQARRDLRCRTIAYGDDPVETIDLFDATRADGPAPLLVFVHGGYWRSLSKDDFSWIAPAYVARGIAVAVIDYGLAPRYPLEAIVAQVRRAIARLWLDAASLGVDRRRIVVSGHSAGGHLTAMMLTVRWPELDPRLPPDVLAGGVAVSGLFDLEPIRHTPYLNADLQLTLDRVAPLSPLYLPPATDAPLVTAVGGAESDEFLRHDRNVGLAWSHVLRADVPLPGENHFTACERFAETGHLLFETTAALCMA